MYDDMIDINHQIKKQLEIETKKRWTLLYDDDYCYRNMTTNLLEVFKNILKNVRGFLVTTIVKITFFRTNKYFVDRRVTFNDYISHGVLCPP